MADTGTTGSLHRLYRVPDPAASKALAGTALRSARQALNRNCLRLIATLRVHMLTAREKRCSLILLIGSIIASFFVAATRTLALENTPQVSAGELVRETVTHELEAAQGISPKHMFRSRKQLPRGSQTRLYVETKDAMAGMTIASNDRPLNPQQKKAEEDHLAWLAGNPEQLRKKRAREKEDEDRTLRILRALPNAFRYEYESGNTENSGPDLGKPGNRLVRIKFTPNPTYDPPTRVEQVLGGMQGYLLIDPATLRIARLDGTLFRDVNFGWGIIGHLDRGGRFLVQQTEVGDGSWQISAMRLKISGKILLFKAISITSDEVFSDFQPVPADTTFAKGIELLKAEQARLAHAREQNGEGKAER